MTPQELKINNLVWLIKNGERKVYQIDSGFDLYKLDESDCADIEPIELNEEWLLKMGFEKQISFLILIEGLKFKLGGKSLEVSWNDVNKWYVGFRNFDEGRPDGYVFLMSDLSYVHEL